jgi:hypothetical protein
MKIFAVILSLYVLALSVSFCSDTCSVGDNECQTEQHDCADCCSPFSLCNTCVGFVTTDIVYTETHPQELSAEINMYELHIYTDIFLDGIWQPPKFA